MKCEICNQGPPEGPAIYRLNKPGEMPARWRCKKHLDDGQEIDPEVLEITEAIEEDNRVKQEIVGSIEESGKTLWIVQ